jgi:hypothetical protein
MTNDEIIEVAKLWFEIWKMGNATADANPEKIKHAEELLRASEDETPLILMLVKLWDRGVYGVISTNPERWDRARELVTTLGGHAVESTSDWDRQLGTTTTIKFVLPVRQ